MERLGMEIPANRSVRCYMTMESSDWAEKQAVEVLSTSDANFQ